MDKPHGKEAVTRAIIEAAIPLIAARGIPSVTFRDIAGEAGVNHGLITHYFGSKDELVRQVSLHIADTLFATVRDKKEDLRAVWERGFGDQAVLIRAMVRILLDTPSDQATLQSPRFIAEILNWVQAEQDKFPFRATFEPEVFLYLVASLLIGSEVLGPHLRMSLNLSEQEFAGLRPRAFQAFTHNTERT
jgi:AcrR family transcriptional regulator